MSYGQSPWKKSSFSRRAEDGSGETVCKQSPAGRFFIQPLQPEAISRRPGDLEGGGGTERSRQKKEKGREDEDGDRTATFKIQI